MTPERPFQRFVRRPNPPPARDREWSKKVAQRVGWALAYAADVAMLGAVVYAIAAWRGCV